MSTTVFHKYNEIGHLLNGYARVVIYETTAFNVITNKYDPLFSPNMNRPISMDEGQLKGGIKLTGFGRFIDFESSATKIGYFQNGTPQGKLMYYNNGKLEKQGIWEEL